ncbi:DeoR/GlpR family DNA-binding transcription regulator [Hydrogenophaga sp.]|uniref:DeoR/GlpR family DNA-binding transcription regulator n=1 Tax=Hydrogenophaga sp. TaxID=1904254 RepID=UPI003569EDCC
MNLNPRHTQLLDAVRAQGPLTIEALAERFDVTLQTVRRDVQRLAEAGLLARFHGGVRMPGSTTENIAYRQRQAMHSEAKKRIARSIAQRVPNGCSLVMNIGTTIEAVAHELLQHRGLRVITNNLHVAALLSTNSDCEVIVAGGMVRAADQGIVGEATVDFMRQFRVDIGLIGISGIEADGSLRDFDYREVKVARTIIEQSREVWLAADHTKFNRPAMVELAHLREIDVLFTDSQPSHTFQELMVQADVECVTATTTAATAAATATTPH